VNGHGVIVLLFIAPYFIIIELFVRRKISIFLVADMLELVTESMARGVSHETQLIPRGVSHDTQLIPPRRSSNKQHLHAPYIGVIS
jgi:hypothetical protein